VRVLAAQIGHALLGDDHLHGMLAVIDVRHQRNDGRDLAALGGGGATEDDR